MLDTLPVVEAAPINSARALPVTIAHQCPAGLQQEARAMQQMWRSALKVILGDFATEDAARKYLRSTDGQMVLELAGLGGQRLDKLTLDPLEARLEVRREARARAGLAPVLRRPPPVPLDQRERRNGILRPLPGSITAQVWSACDGLKARGRATTTGTLTAVLGQAGPSVGSIAGALVSWRKFHAAGPRG